MREKSVVVAPFHGGFGMGLDDLASEPDCARNNDRLVCQMADNLRWLFVDWRGGGRGREGERERGREKGGGRREGMRARREG